jgi:hypothetical protein
MSAGTARADDPVALAVASTRPPTLVVARGNVRDGRSCRTGVELWFEVRTEHPDGLPVTLALDGAPPGSKWDARLGTFSWVPTDGDRGRHSLRLTASDGTRQTVQQLGFEVTDNHPPELGTRVLTFTANFADARPLGISDADDDKPRARVTGLPGGAYYRAEEHTIVWTPTDDQVGRHPVGVRLTDGVAETRSELVLEVVDAPRAEKWKGFLRPGAGYTLYAPSDDIYGLLHGPSIDLVLATWASGNHKSGPSRGRIYLSAELLQSTREGTKDAFAFAAGFALSFERTALRRFLIPTYGLELGAVFQDNFGNRFHATPYVGAELYSTKFLSVSVRGGYRMVPSDMPTLAGPQASLGASFGWW